MCAAGHQVVHQVVIAGNRIENATHTALLFVPRNAFVAEISVGVLLGLSHRAASIDGVFNEARNHWLFGSALATKPNYSSGGLGKAGGLATTGLCLVATPRTQRRIASACGANSTPAFGRLHETIGPRALAAGTSPNSARNPRPARAGISRNTAPSRGHRR